MRKMLYCCCAALVLMAGTAFGETQRYDSSFETSDTNQTVRKAVADCADLTELTSASTPPANFAIISMTGGECLGRMETFVHMQVASVCRGLVTVGQGNQVFLNWVKRNPNKLNYVFTRGFIEAFQEAFPCSAQ
jgi:hypothetical protein